MPGVDRRGFFRLLRCAAPAVEDQQVKKAEAAMGDPRMGDLADRTLRLLADVGTGNEERLAEGALLTEPYDLVYMRVTASHIVFSAAIGFSAIVPAPDVRAFDTGPPEDAGAYGNLVTAVLRYHHRADLEHITRSYTFRFQQASPLPAAIRAACALPEPETEQRLEGSPSPAGPEATGGARASSER